VEIVSVLVLLALGTGLTLMVGWRPRTLPPDHRWIATGLGGMFKDIAGTLAGFTIATATFLGSLTQDKEAPALAIAVGLLLLSFLILMSTAMLYSSMPSTTNSDSAATNSSQALIDLLANTAYFIGAALGWLALRPLLQLIGLPDLADAFTWLLLITAVIGGARLAALTYRLSAANLAACLSVPLLGFGLPLLCWIVLPRVRPGIEVENDAVLPVAFVAFGVSICALGLQTMVLMVHGHAALNQRVLTKSHRMALAMSQAAVLVIAMTWITLAAT
jgi:hypothetical protein